MPTLIPLSDSANLTSPVPLFRRQVNPAFLLLPSFENGVPLLHESFCSFPRVFCPTQIT